MEGYFRLASSGSVIFLLPSPSFGVGPLCSTEGCIRTSGLASDVGRHWLDPTWWWKVTQDLTPFPGQSLLTPDKVTDLQIFMHKAQTNLCPAVPWPQAPNHPPRLSPALVMEAPRSVSGRRPCVVGVKMPQLYLQKHMVLLSSGHSGTQGFVQVKTT